MAPLERSRRVYVSVSASNYTAGIRVEYVAEHGEVHVFCAHDALLVFGLDAARCLHDAVGEVLRLVDDENSAGADEISDGRVAG